MNWPPWQASKTNPLASDLPTTVSGTPHDGIKLGCWRCGKLLIDEGHIHRIKDTSVWTNSGFDSANFIFDREREQYNEFKKCKFVPVRVRRLQAISRDAVRDEVLGQRHWGFDD